MNDEKKLYFGVSKTPFKELFRNHKKNLIMSDIEIAPNCPNTSGN